MSAPHEHKALDTFVRESNRIEGIGRVRACELEAHASLLRHSALSITHIEDFVATVAPGKRLRREPGMDVLVGDHYPPRGGAHIADQLQIILNRANSDEDPFEVHQAYEHLHPFMDGNGRSGRAVWLWQMVNWRGAQHALRMGFLHLWYYQSLSAWRET